jgi:uncharacterized protein DUF4124
MNSRPALAVASLLALVTTLAAPICDATLYKWTDENGRVVYGDQPPASAKSERLNAGVAPADPAALRDMANKDADIRKRMQQRSDDAAKSDKDQAEAKRKLDTCAQTRGRIRTMREPAPVYKYNEKGERVFFEAADRQKAIAESEKNLKDLNCPPAPPS